MERRRGVNNGDDWMALRAERVAARRAHLSETEPGEWGTPAARRRARVLAHHEGATMTLTAAPTHEHAARRALAERPVPVPRGWQVLGYSRGAGTPPAPPPPEVTAGLLDKAQVAALGAYAAVIDRVSASREAEAALGAEVDRTALDDATGADEAFARGETTAPPSVGGARLAAFEAQGRFTEAALRASAGALGQLYAVLGPPEAQVAILEKAWAALAAERDRHPEVLRGHVARVCWALDLGERLTPSPKPTALVALDAVPASTWAEGCEAVLDELGATVAERIAALSEDEAPA
jgi:hypothetical protein